MKKNNPKTIIKRLFIVLFSPIIIIFVPYFIGDALLPDSKPIHVIPLVWLIGGLLSIFFVGLILGLYEQLKSIYQWIIYESK